MSRHVCFFFSPSLFLLEIERTNSDQSTNQRRNMIDVCRNWCVFPRGCRCVNRRKSANSYSAKSDRDESNKKKKVREKIIVNLGKIAGQFRKEKRGFFFPFLCKILVNNGAIPTRGTESKQEKKPVWFTIIVPFSATFPSSIQLPGTRLLFRRA